MMSEGDKQRRAVGEQGLCIEHGLGLADGTVEDATLHADEGLILGGLLAQEVSDGLAEAVFGHGADLGFGQGVVVVPQARGDAGFFARHIGHERVEPLHKMRLVRENGTDLEQQRIQRCPVPVEQCHHANECPV